MEKVGRNDPCPCGSGEKYKKCCIDKTQLGGVDIKSQIERLRAKQMLIEKQQGLGRPIISTEFKGYRMVAVGKRMYHSQKWRTFHDFLFDYIKLIFGKEWGREELGKSLEERHPVLQWYDMAMKYMHDNQGGEGNINSAPMTGAVSAYINLSYNLYLLEHNVEIKTRLINRLKDKDQFRGALYETYVAAEFIKAGFDLEIENEEDSRITHCEFTAVSKLTGRRYSIEAKARQPNKEGVGIGNQLYEALKKKAKYERVIFIDMNIPDFLNQVEIMLGEIRRKEQILRIDGQDAPQAYLFITNHPFEYDLSGIGQGRMGFSHGFKITDFSFDFKFTNIRDVLKAREKHKDMFALIKSICEHQEIPTTFDGEHPEFAFRKEDSPPRLIIGNKYLVPGEDGKDIEGILENATLLEQERKIWGVYKTVDGKRIICTNPITDEELIAYRRQPDTFFGVHLKQGKKTDNPLDLFDFFYESYKETSRERLLEFLKDSPDFERLKSLDREELLVTYCERVVYSAVGKQRVNKCHLQEM
jgi:hypothetical protein